ncbi:OmpA family protein [Arenibacter certesii]|nr:OmpA family protein [Arenibacter certesii]
MNKLNIILISISTLLSASLFAQSERTSDNSAIVMTKTELNSFLNTIAEARRVQNQERKRKSEKQDLAELRLKYKAPSEYQWRPEMEPRFNDISNQQILMELRYLNQRINDIGSNSNRTPMMGSDRSTLIMPGSTGASPIVSAPYPQNDRDLTTIIPRSNRDLREINELKAKIDSLMSTKALDATARKDDFLSDSLNTVIGGLKDIRRQLDSLETKMTISKEVDKPVEIKEPEVDKSYFKQQVYFDNNSETLNADYIPFIQDLTQTLINNPEAKLMLEGWASPTGKSSYNKLLSMRRAEAVKQAFLNNRIDASRVITAFRGEDKTSSEQHARRVDMSIIVK